MTPEALRALAARVVAEEPSRELDAEIAQALGHRVEWRQTNYTMEIVPVIHWMPPHPYAGMKEPLAHYTTSRDASARAMPNGWRVSLHQDDDGQWNATGIPQPYEPGRSISERAPTEPQARIALALLCMAAEQEKGPDE